MQEQRASPRLQVDLNVRWETLKSQGRGALSDLSSSGCFVLTGGDVFAGDLIRLQITSPQRVAIQWGQAVYAVAEIGFALRFVFGNQADQRSVESLVEFVRDRD